MTIHLGPVGIVLGAMAIMVVLGLAAIFGAWLTESDNKRTAGRSTLMPLAQAASEPVQFGEPELLTSARS